jgi:hypothetical protein
MTPERARREIGRGAGDYPGLVERRSFQLSWHPLPPRARHLSAQAAAIPQDSCLGGGEVVAQEAIPPRGAPGWHLPDTVNQVTGALLTPDEIREIVAYVKTYRPSSTPFGVAVNGELATDEHQKAELVQRYEAAGAMWWVEYEAPSTSLAEYRARIRQGLPRG